MLNKYLKIPENINSSSIIARIRVLETLAYKLKSNFKNKSTEFEKTKNNLLNSYSNVIFQIKKTLEKESQKIINPNIYIDFNSLILPPSKSCN